MTFDEHSKQRIKTNGESWKDPRLFLIGIFVIVGFFLVAAIFEYINSNANERIKNLVKTKRKLASTTDSPTPTPQIPTPTPSPTPTPTPVSNWSYSTSEYKMSNRDVEHALILSTNSFIFDFPYGGSQRATLNLRKHPRWGRDVILSIERGQFICPSYSGCRVRVRFDKGKARYYRANEAADNSSDVIFIRGYNRFVSRLKRAKKLYIEATFYQEGNIILEFDVEGLKF